MKYLIIVLTYFIFCSPGFAQTQAIQADSCRNAYYLEYSGNAPELSLNYERTVMQLTNSKTVLHIGFGAAYGTFEEDDFFVPSIPIEITQIFLNGKHHFEIGLGVTPFLSKAPMFSEEFSNYDQPISDNFKAHIMVIPEIGYRIQKPGKGWLFKVGFTPIIYNSSAVDSDKFKYRTNFGIAVGRTF